MAQHTTFHEIQRKAKAVLQSRQDFRATIKQDGHPRKMLGRLAPISSPNKDNEKSSEGLQQLKEMRLRRQELHRALSGQLLLSDLPKPLRMKFGLAFPKREGSSSSSAADTGIATSHSKLSQSKMLQAQPWRQARSALEPLHFHVDRTLGGVPRRMRQRTFHSKDSSTLHFDEMLTQDVVKPYVASTKDIASDNGAYAECLEYLQEPSEPDQQQKEHVFWMTERLQRNVPGQTELRMQHVALDDNLVIPLATGIQHNTVLHTLSLCHNSIGNRGCAAIASVYPVNQTLVDVNLGGNMVGDAGVLAFADVLGKGGCPLQRLNLNGRDMLSNDHNFMPAVEVRGRHKRRHVNQMITERGMTGLCSALVLGNCSLMELHIGSQAIGDAGAAALAACCAQKDMLAFVTLRDNGIGSDGMRTLANALRSNRSLQFLDLSVNCMRDESVPFLKRGVLNNPTLTWIDLSHNLLTRAGRKVERVLGRALEARRTRTHILTHNNPMGAAASASIERSADTVRARQTIAARKHAMAIPSNHDVLNLRHLVRKDRSGKVRRRRRSLWKEGFELGDDSSNEQ